jgi:hypothetical protein
MHPAIAFKTAKFDTGKERPNPINPIAGESILNWLRDEVFHGKYPCTKPDYEDWGWYMNVSYHGRTYMVGGIAFDEDRDDAGLAIEWLVQIDKERSIRERLLGREKLDGNDPFVQEIFHALSEEASFADVEWS